MKNVVSEISKTHAFISAEVGPYVFQLILSQTEPIIRIFSGRTSIYVRFSARFCQRLVGAE